MMKVNSAELFNLVQERFGGNLSLFCKALDLDYSGVWKVLNHKSAGTSKFIPAFFQYCKDNGLPFEQYFL